VVTIAPLQSHQVSAAKMVISSVAQRIFEPGMAPEQFAEILEAEKELLDVDNYQHVYDGQRGIFLTVLENDRVIGTGAITRIDVETAELKRMWLLEDYHGKGLGYQVILRLFDFAKRAGYKRIYLQTSLQSQRALAFYRRLGFKEIPVYFEPIYHDDIAMEFSLDSWPK